MEKVSRPINHVFQMKGIVLAGGSGFGKWIRQFTEPDGAVEFDSSRKAVSIRGRPLNPASHTGSQP